MKALESLLGIQIKSDRKGREALRKYIAEGDDEGTIELSSGEKYKISNKPPEQKTLESGSA